MNRKTTVSEATARRIVREFGREVLLDEYLFMAAFHDFAPDHKLEASVLSIALYQNVGTFYVGSTTAAEQMEAVRKTLTALRPILAERMILAVVQIFFYALGWDASLIRQALAPPPALEQSIRISAASPPHPLPIPDVQRMQILPVKRFTCSIAMVGKEPHAPKAYNCIEASLRHMGKAELTISNPSPDMGCGQLQVRVYRFSDYGAPMTPILLQNFSGSKATVTIPLTGTDWTDDTYAILAVIKPPFANTSEEAAYDVLHPEAVLPSAYRKHTNYAAHFYEQHLRLTTRYYEEIRFLSDAVPLRFKEGRLQSVSILAAGEPYSFRIIPWLKTKKIKHTCAYIKVLGPNRQLLENLKREITLEADSSCCHIPAEHIPLMPGTYTYEISLYGSNTVTGQFTVS